jgi:hypothetical protein
MKNAPRAEFEQRLSRWQSDPSLLEPEQFVRRTEILDELDRYSEADLVSASAASDLINQIRALATKLESINVHLFNSIRHQIRAGLYPGEFASIFSDLAITPRGVNYDHLDDLIAGIFQFDPPSSESRILDPDSVFYQPTPARHIFHLITAASVTKADTLIDLGSGLGHVPLLVSICTGATAIGIELEPAWIASARHCATALNLHNVVFQLEDAREADLSSGTIFYLYTPFTGATLASVLHSLRIQAALRPIRICTFGPCTLALSNQSWLEPLTTPAADRVTIFLPRA